MGESKGSGSGVTVPADATRLDCGCWRSGCFLNLCDVHLTAMEVSIREHDEMQAALMPDTEAALRVLNEAYTRLKKLGWRDAVYAPSDGTTFNVLEVGSTGIHVAHRDDISFWIAADGDSWPSRPVVFRPLGDTDAENWIHVARRRAAMRRPHPALPSSIPTTESGESQP